MTNLEWIRTLSEEEFADWLYDEWLHHLQYRWSSSRGGLIIWLKDHKTENSSEKPNNCEGKNYCDDCLYTDTCDSKEFFYACTSKATISKMEQVEDEPMKTTDYCDICKRDMCKDCIADATNPYCVPSHYEINYEPKDEPHIVGKHADVVIIDESQTDCAWK